MRNNDQNNALLFIKNQGVRQEKCKIDSVFLTNFKRKVLNMKEDLLFETEFVHPDHMMLCCRKILQAIFTPAVNKNSF